MIYKALRLAILFVLVLIPRFLEAATVQSIDCHPSFMESECYIHIQGKIYENEVLIIPYVADADILSFSNIELGRTGFFFGHKFYAAFLPRSYSLEKLKNIESPVLKLHAWSFWSLDVGIKTTKHGVVIQDQKQALKTYMLLLMKPFWMFILSLVISLLALKSMQTTYVDGWLWTNRSKKIFHFSSTLFALSMTRILRFSIPSIMSRFQHYIFHSFSYAIAIWALTEMLLESDFVDKSSNPKKIRNTQIKKSIFSKVNVIILLLNLVSFIIFFQIYEMQLVHSISVLVQAFFLLCVVIYQLLRTDFEYILVRSMPSSTFFMLCLFSTAIVIMRDSIEYYWFHRPGVHYYSPEAMLLVLFASFVRSAVIQDCELKAKILSDRVRSLLRDITHGRDQLQLLADEIHKNWSSDRVSILSIINDEVIVMSSSGPNPLNRDSEPKPVGPILKILINKKQPIYIASVDDFEEVHRRQGFERSCFLIPLIQENKIIGAISIMGSMKTRLSPYQSYKLIVSTSFIESEVVAALNNALLEQSQSEIKEYAVGMSGVVFEHMNAWGHIQKNSTSSRRVVISADGLKSKYLEHLVSTSPILYSLAKEFKAELYAGWIAIKQTFEMVSADVHGDEFWIVTPLKFKNQEWASLGAEKVALICAYLIERYAFEVSKKPRYKQLETKGSRVVVGAGNIELMGLGVEKSICPSLEGQIMYKLHRIRSESKPGFVLVDTDDSLLKSAINDTQHFECQKYYSYLKEASFKDLHTLPDVTILKCIQSFSFLTETQNQISDMVATSPYLRN